MLLSYWQNQYRVDWKTSISLPMVISSLVIELNLVSQLVHRPGELVEAVDEAAERPDRAFRRARVLGGCKSCQESISCLGGKFRRPRLNHHFETELLRDRTFGSNLQNFSFAVKNIFVQIKLFPPKLNCDVLIELWWLDIGKNFQFFEKFNQRMLQEISWAQLSTGC